MFEMYFYLRKRERIRMEILYCMCERILISLYPLYVRFIVVEREAAGWGDLIITRGAATKYRWGV